MNTQSDSRGPRMRLLREGAKFTRAGLARALRVAWTRVDYLEGDDWGSGVQQPQLDTLRRLAEVLGEEVWQVWGYEHPNVARWRMAQVGIEV